MRALTLAAAVAMGSLSASAVAAPSVYTIDGDGQVRAASASAASLQRRPPARPPSDLSRPHGDPDALRYLLYGAPAEVPSIVDIVSVSATGRVRATLRGVALTAVPCPKPLAPASRMCATTAPIRVVADAVDAAHPLTRERSVEGSLGGGLRIVGAGARVLASVRIAAPMSLGIERLRGRLRFVAVRLSPGGALPLGASAKDLRHVAAAALARVNALWAACGISFGDAADVELTIVDPPPSHLLSVGCEHGLTASGGELRFRVARADATGAGEPFTVTTEPGMQAPEVARRVARVLRRAGWSASVSDNPRIMAAAGATSDISVRTATGAFARLDAPSAGPLSTDATMTLCIGDVALEDGLSHFTDVDSMVGTREERTLVKAYDDRDPTTIDVYLIPGFARGGRIGESFIGADAGSLRNVVIIDRAGVRSNSASFALAHELGHVLLDDPGHPDDFGVDMPTRLMDADAADGSAFGPRRISLEECQQAIRQSGPDARTPLLTAWPLAPLRPVPPMAARPQTHRQTPLPPWLRAFY